MNKDEAKRKCIHKNGDISECRQCCNKCNETSYNFQACLKKCLDECDNDSGPGSLSFINSTGRPGIRIGSIVVSPGGKVGIPFD